MKALFTTMLLWLVLGVVNGCRTVSSGPTTGHPSAGDEIIVAGQRFHTGTRVVTWLDDGGYNAYRAVRPPAGSVAMNFVNHTPRTLSATAMKAPTPLARLQATVDQFVLHYDVCGLSKICFNVLQQRGLSTHFLLDIDGTVYQTLDLQERALHATVANNRSIGIEIAHIGAYAPGETKTINDLYQRDAADRPFIRVPPRIADPGIYTQPFLGRPARPFVIKGQIQNTTLQQYDYTPEQYAALAKLIAALHRVFPKIKIDYPRDKIGRLIPRKLSDATLEKYQGVLGHYHIQENKVDPGPTLQWDALIKQARALAR